MMKGNALHAIITHRLIHCTGYQDQMHEKLSIKSLLTVCILISCSIYLLSVYMKTLMTFVPIPFTNYKQTLTNDNTLDTFQRRFEQFLNERNVSLLSYERADATSDILQTDINNKITQLNESQQREILNIRNGQELRHGCQQSCCWSQRKMINFYYGEKGRFPTDLDRLSQIDMKLLADLHFGQLPLPVKVQLPKLTDDILPCLQNNTVIFVETTDVGNFLTTIHAKISVSYILITGDTDVSCPVSISQSHSQLLDQIFAGQTRIIHWFAMNCDLGNNELWKKSKIFSCIPLGISQWYDQRFYMQLASGKDDSIYNTDLKTNDYWVFTSFSLQFEHKHRKPLWESSCNGRLKNISKCFYRSYPMDIWKYYSYIGRSKFVFSPPGVGIDCYRTWEALYLGSIPIVINGTLNSLFEDLPVLIVNSYEEITLELLKAVYDNMTKQTFDYRRLYKGYWQRKINYYRNFTETTQFQYNASKH